MEDYASDPARPHDVTLTIRPLDLDDLAWLRALMNESWGGEVQIVNGEAFRPANQPGFLAEEDGERLGVITYEIDGESCMIGLLQSLRERAGVGSALLDAVVATAEDRDCRRVWVVTTNDAAKAQRLYERRGFRVAEVRPGAVDSSRELKPTIPQTGESGVPMTDEIEYELRW